MKIAYEVHKCFIPIWERNDWRYAILMGGRGQGRSGTASRYTVSQLLSTEYTRGALMRATREDIRASSWQAIKDRITEQQANKVFHITDNDMAIQYGKNSIRAFGFRASSGSLTARLKSLEDINFAWIEEAEETNEEEFRKFDDTLRTTRGRIRLVLTLNTPSINHWILKKWFNMIPGEIKGFYVPELKPEVKDVLYIPGTWRQNEPNLDPATVKRYMGYQVANPAYFYQVIEGLAPEVVMGRIYSGWKEIPIIPHEARLLGYGLDFGYFPDPDAVVAVYYHNGGYIFDEKLYQTENSPERLAQVCLGLPPAPFVADTNEPRMIASLRQAGVSIIETEKGKGSVEYGIKHVQGLPISYTARSLNLKKEYENYAWLFDKDGDNKQVEDPKCANHLLSSIRYFCSRMVRNKLEDIKMRSTASIRTSIQTQKQFVSQRGV